MSVRYADFRRHCCHLRVLFLMIDGELVLVVMKPGFTPGDENAVEGEAPRPVDHSIFITGG